MRYECFSHILELKNLSPGNSACGIPAEIKKQQKPVFCFTAKSR